MEEIYKIFDFKDEKEWISGRMNGIGGSDASSIVGMNPYKTNIDLFEEKIGRKIPEDISDNQWGTGRDYQYVFNRIYICTKCVC